MLAQGDVRHRYGITRIRLYGGPLSLPVGYERFAPQQRASDDR
jgi:hypothetical protein